MIKNKFKNLFSSKEYEQINNIDRGIFYGKCKDEGYWELVLKNSGEILFRSEDEDTCLKYSQVINNMCNWDRVESLNQIKELNYDVYSEIISISENYGCEKKFNGLYLNTLDQATKEVKYKYYVFNNLLKKIKGKHLVNGLAYHLKGRNYEFVHVPTGKIVTMIEGNDKVEKLANELRTLMDWSLYEAYESISKNQIVLNYLKELKTSILNGGTKPELTDEISTEILYLSNPKLKERKKVYDDAINELNSLYGMIELKKQVSDMMNELKVNQQLKNAGIKDSAQTLHTIFYGPAGTGKTHVARIMARLLYSMGYLDKTDIVETTADGMIAGYIGQTAGKAQEFIDKAMGGVLFIDEAYGFSSGSLKGSNASFGDDAIRVILAAAENNRNNLCIILGGYENEMKQMMKMNEGLESRFPKKNRFYFRDYTPKQLSMITRDMLLKDNYVVDEEFVNEMEKVIEKISKNGAINGNARWSRNFKEQIISNHKKYIDEKDIKDLDKIVNIDKEIIEYAAGLKTKVVEVEGLEEVKQDSLRKIYNMIGLTDLKTELQEIMDYLSIQKRKYNSGLSTEKPNMHMIFSGPPGTGKTTVAEHVGQFLKGAGLLSNGHFIQISGTDLTKGDPTEAVENIINKAMGGILFIDEAYSLCKDMAGRKAVDILIQEMENKRHDLVVILAGYENEMKELLNTNPGFESRVVYDFKFPYYTSEEINQIVKLELNKRNLKLIGNSENYLKEKIKEKELNEGKIEGNGRWARNFAQKLEIKQSSRIAKNDQFNLTDVIEEDIEKAFRSM